MGGAGRLFRLRSGLSGPAPRRAAQVPAYRGEVAQLLSASLGLPVDIASLSADWQGLHPRLQMGGVTIHDAVPASAALSLDRVDAEVGWSSLLRMRLRLNRLEIDSPQLAIRRGADGQIFVAGLPVVAGGDQGGFHRLAPRPAPGGDPQRARGMVRCLRGADDPGARQAGVPPRQPGRSSSLRPARPAPGPPWPRPSICVATCAGATPPGLPRRGVASFTPASTTPTWGPGGQWVDYPLDEWCRRACGPGSKSPMAGCWARQPTLPCVTPACVWPPSWKTSP
jgi:hypothetical protein